MPQLCIWVWEQPKKKVGPQQMTGLFYLVCRQVRFSNPANGDEWLESFQTSLSSVIELRTLTLGRIGYGFDYGLKCELNLHSPLESLPFL